MSKNFKIFLIALILCLPFWWGVNVFQEKIEDFLFWKKMADNPQILLAQMAQEERLAKLKPIRNKKINNLEIEAKAALSVFIDNQGVERILFEKDGDKVLPIASLTKLMTANVVLKHYDISQIVGIKKLLYILLIKSDNEAAIALAEIIGKEAFVDLMNLEAKNLGLNNTYFANPTGLDPEFPTEPINHSTAQDLVKFAKYLTLERPLIWDISTVQTFEDKVNTNELLEEIPGIIGGKTGETPRAGKCLLLVVQAPKNKGYIINVILNSENHFKEMKELIDWTKYAYKW